ncbi:hypothetical protein MIAR_12590 [Microbacterium arabinogalactanolyticum]|nr:hypothetical protein MIAR_12590 [Microbacterium arabinogalactanolyticum]
MLIGGIRQAKGEIEVGMEVCGCEGDGHFNRIVRAGMPDRGAGVSVVKRSATDTSSGTDRGQRARDPKVIWRDPSPLVM